jgi:hypothetical protein
MSQLGFEPATPVFERVKTAHALDCAVSVIGVLKGWCLLYDLHGIRTHKREIRIVFSIQCYCKMD